MASTDVVCLPISELSNYQTKWTIKARITNKAPLRTFKRGTGEGKVFHVDLLDAMGGEIRASFFNDAADKFFEMLAPNKVFTFSKGSIKIANKQYNSTNHRYELTFEKDAVVTEVAEDESIAAAIFHFVDIKTVQSKPLPCRVDLCGVVSAFKAPATIKTREGKEVMKRDITLADDTGTAIELTLWGATALLEDSKFEGNPTLAVKNVLVKEFNGGRSGSVLDSNAIIFSPAGPEADRIRQWWQKGGSNQAVTSISVGLGGGGARARNAQHCTFGAMRKLAEQVTEEPVHFNLVGRLALVQTTKQGEKQPLYYNACAEPRDNGMSCNKRVDEGGFCASCGRAGKTAVRMNLRCRFADFSDSAWLTTFHEAAENVLGMKGEEVKVMEVDGAGREALEAQIKKRYFSDPLQLIVRGKLDTYMGEARPNVSCVDVRKVDRRQHGRVMLKEIQEMLAA